MSINPIYYSEDVKKIDNIEFSIYTNKDIKLYSAVIDDPFGIDLPESYENYEPKKGGLVDLRLGTCDIYLPCTTCGENSLDCPGHFGHTELAEPVFHFGFLNHVKNILQCICLNCSKILIPNSDNLIKKILNKKYELRFKEVKFLIKNINQCYNCGVPVPKIKREVKDNGSIKIIIERTSDSSLDDNIKQAPKSTTDSKLQTYIKKVKESLSPRDCYNIFKNLSNFDCNLLGFNSTIQRPEDLIIERFPIPPVIIRPTAKVDFMSAATMEDGLTHKISDIIIANKRVRQELEKEMLINELSTHDQYLFNLLQYNVATYFDNDSVSLPRTEFKTGGRLIKSIKERINGKYGRVRCNLMGKRVDYSARTVITSDPYINIDQVGVPKKIAMELTIPEEVTPYNIKYLSDLIKNGRDIYPGANFVLRFNYRDSKIDIQKIDLKYRKKAIKLNYGDIVERHIVDNDYVLFNRQPTLHKPSMMGHKIQVINNDFLNTFRMNVSVCKPYNADFDGDEMNIHLGQSIQALNEVKRIANVKYQIISVKDSNPIIGCQQDTLSGAYMLSEPFVRIKGWEAANLLCNTTSKSKYNLLMDKEYTGHEIFSYIIPEGINMIKKSNNKIIFNIDNGNLTNGYLDKSSLSFAKNSIIHFIWDKYGSSKTTKFIDDSQKIILNYLLLRGQTVGFLDTLIDKDLNNKIEQFINNEILKYKYSITEYENNLIQLSLDKIETQLKDKLSPMQATIGEMLMSYYNRDNFFWTSAKSGAKGNLTNIAQVSGAIGQIVLQEGRIKKSIQNRTLIYFHRDDDTPEARGFIKNSFLKGLNIYEVFIMSSAGRESLIDTAIKTAQTGYIQRQLIKGLEDLSINYDSTNRNAKNIMIQLVYGENGIDQSKQTELLLNIINMNNITIAEKLCFTNDEIKKLEKCKFKSLYDNDNKLSLKDLDKFNNKYINKLIKFRDELRTIQTNALLNYKFLEEKYLLPINLFRIIQDYNNNKENLELNPLEIVNEIEKFITDYDNRIITVLKPDDKYMKNDDRNIKFLLEIALNEYLSPKKCIFEYGLSKNNFIKMMNEIKLSFMKAIVEPGEMVGIIAAQSIGEPTSQFTLNTKHTAGSSSKKSTNTGVGRIQELLHYSKNIKTPQMIIYFNDTYNKNESVVKKTASYLKYLSIRYLVSNIEVYYDLNKDDKLSNILKNDNVSNPFFINNQKIELSKLPFVFRLKMNIEKMLEKETTMLDIKTKFILNWYKNYTNLKNIKKHEKEIINSINKCAILSNNITNKEYYIHIRFSMNTFNYNIIIDFLKIICDDIILKGIENINDYDINNERHITYDKNTGDIIEDKEYYILTSGINFERIKYMKNINLSKSRCNDIATTLRLYGIEATRQILLYEYLIIYGESGSKVNHTHLSLLVDQMCHLGEIISIDRHGLSKIDMDPIAKASFEKTMDHFINAAIFNEIDNVNSVSSRIAVGRVINGGTGVFDLLLDTKKLENSEYIENESTRITFIPLEEDSLIKDIKI